MATAAAGLLSTGATAEQASRPTSAAAGQLDVSGGGDISGHSCAVVAEADLRCWGFGGSGRLGYAGTSTIGDDEIPAAAGPVSFGPGGAVKAISAGAFHSCAVLQDNSSVRCWGFGGDGRLGYMSTETIGDNETPGSAGAVDLGPGRTAKAISAGGGHTCAVLDDDSVRCWGFGSDGRLGYGNRDNVGDDETPGSKDPVFLGAGRTAKAISAGRDHTCALLDDDSVRCWGIAGSGRLGYGDRAQPDPNPIGDNETPGSMGPVSIGAGAKAISAGDGHSCALLSSGGVRCWGFGGNGRLGYADTSDIGDDEAPAAAGPVDLGEGRVAHAISAGDSHTCALLDDGGVRCWGYGPDGRLGYAATSDVGDDEHPWQAGPVDIGPGRAAVAISAGGRHSCARLDDASVRCWGYGGHGRLGYCNERSIGDDETPGSAGPVSLGPGGTGSGCPATPGDGGARTGAGPAVDPLAAEAARRRGLRGCLAEVARHARRESGRARRLSGSRRARARRHARRHKSRLRRRCLKRWGRTPGRVAGLKARAISRTKVVLTFKAPGTDGARPPAARAYLVKQSHRRIRSARGFRRAQTLCKGSCRFKDVARVGGEVELTVEDLRPRTTYYYAVAARDSVSRRSGRRSPTVKVRTR